MAPVARRTRRMAAALAVAALAVAAGWLAGSGSARAAGGRRTGRVGSVAGTPSAAEGDVLPLTHVRALNGKVAGVLRAGMQRSATFRRVALAVEHSDVIVLVRTGVLASIPSKMAFRGASSKAAPPEVRRRFVEITLNVPELDERLVPWLGHELEHAFEIASHPEVTDAATLAAFYRSHGESWRPGEWCTAEAQAVRAAVAKELAAAPDTGSRR